MDLDTFYITVGWGLTAIEFAKKAHCVVSQRKKDVAQRVWTSRSPSLGVGHTGFLSLQSSVTDCSYEDFGLHLSSSHLPACRLWTRPLISLSPNLLNSHCQQIKTEGFLSDFRISPVLPWSPDLSDSWLLLKHWTTTPTFQCCGTIGPT